MTEQELVRLSHDWDRAMVTNDADAIGAFMADEWRIVGSDGQETPKSSFLAQVRSGLLIHHVMTSEEQTVELYADTALVFSRGVSGGTFHGVEFREHERASSVFIRRDGRWQCILTHLVRLA